ncbi:hypothetical protein [Hyphococcus sp.]|jgi:membrane protein YqaA with SNARE-associated domain|uniref:hypothetical protein n=1 Tax=Hyphococcus sp. TaxID=2038636 RepID=UPI003D0DB548
MGVALKDPRFWFAGAALWGFAEATFFFIVPDLLLTAAVLAFGLSRAFRFATVAACGAALGALPMVIWGAADAEAARAFLLSVPLIGEDLLLRVHGELEGFWPGNLTVGAVTGAPFKIYAVEAGASGVNPFLFAMVGYVARLARFTLAIALTALGAKLAARLGLQRIVPYGLALAWALIYAFYVMKRLGA